MTRKEERSFVQLLLIGVGFFGFLRAAEGHGAGVANADFLLVAKLWDGHELARTSAAVNEAAVSAMVLFVVLPHSKMGR